MESEFFIYQNFQFTIMNTINQRSRHGGNPLIFPCYPQNTIQSMQKIQTIDQKRRRQLSIKMHQTHQEHLKAKLYRRLEKAVTQENNKLVLQLQEELKYLLLH